MIANYTFKEILIIILISLMGSSIANAQYEIELIEFSTNNFQGGKPSKNLYLVIAFSEDYKSYFFNEENQAAVIKLEPNAKDESSLSFEELHYNKKSQLYEYYLPLENVYQMDKLKPFEIVLSSTDYKNFSRTTFDEKDISRLRKDYEPPGPESNSKQKLKYYKKTGISQGQLFGANTDFRIYKRKSCNAKRREMSKNGVNGVKTMMYGKGF